MDKKEISEIKKQFKLENNSVIRIASCHVSQDGCSIQPPTEFLRLTEDSESRYLALFCKALSGKIGNTLFNMEFPPKDGAEDALYRLRDGHLKEQAYVEEFFGMVANSYQCDEDYTVILAYGCYDAPSADPFEYILCCMCPVRPSKPGLSYDSQNASLKIRDKELWVSPPADAFLYPAFNDRKEDLHGLLYFSKKGAQEEFLRRLVGKNRPLSEKEEREWISGTLADITDGACTFTQVRAVQELAEEWMGEDGARQVGKKELEYMLEEAGFSEEQVDAFDQEYDRKCAGTSLSLSSLADENAVVVKTGGLHIKAENGTDIQTKTVDGRLCIVIPVGTGIAEVNGMACKLG
ncbi:hypothetical protein C818_02670 [Lachnospiraceae bacterium MD308]|nr:hypothetical protein C818_02670 [Lachnospiraceae bacterium MD308]